MKVGDVWVYRDHVHFMKHGIIDEMSGDKIIKIFYENGHDLIRLERLEDGHEITISKKELLEDYVDIRDANEFLQL